MAERFTRLYALPGDLYAEGSPVLIAAGQLLKDTATENVLAQLKLQNIGAKTVSAATVRFETFDPAGRPAGEPFTHTYMDLNCARDAFCAQKEAAPCPDGTARKLQAAVTEVIFADGSVWNAPAGAVWEPLPAAKLRTPFADAYAEKAYGTRLPGAGKYAAEQVKDLWRCGCGALNRAEESECHACKKAFAAFAVPESELIPEGRYAAAKELLASSDTDKLKEAEKLFAALGDHEDASAKAKEAADKIAALEKKKKEEAEAKAKREEAAAKAKKKRRTVTVILLLVAALAALYFFVLKDMFAYNAAGRLLESGQYAKAKTAYTALGDYKDSADMVKECDYQKAVSLFNKGKYEDAMAVFKRLGKYKDSAAQVQKCADAINERDYKAAVALLNEGKYEEAKAAFRRLGDYKDSADMVKECDYQKAVSLFNEGKYENAKTAFAALGEYSDSAAQVQNCIDAIYGPEYEAAVALFNEGKYEEAKTAFAALGDYKDSAAQVQNCADAINERDYDAAVALFNEGKYEEAMAIFAALGDYKDSAAQVQSCIDAICGPEYEAAVKLFNEGKYEEAKAVFRRLGDYKDSADMVTECGYQTAMALLNEGKYEEAKTAFAALGDYKDSADMVPECDYQAAMALFNEGKYEEAKAAFAALGDYKDSADMVKECDYQPAMTLLNEGKYKEAKAAFFALGDYKDSADMVKECDYQKAMTLLNEGKYEEAKTAFAALGDYKDSADMVPECDYQAAMALFNEGKYEEAKAAFAALGNYKDSADMVKECDYQKAKALYAAGDYAGAYILFAQIKGYKDVDTLLTTDKHLMTAIQPGKTVTFGTWRGKPIEWQVLEVKKDGTCVLLSVKGLEVKPYNTKWKPVTWKTCTLRRWLNGEFYETAFSESEKGKIVLTTLKNPDDTIDRYTTRDYVYLLSVDEVNRYFHVDSHAEAEALICLPRQTAVSSGAGTVSKADVDRYQSEYSYPLKVGACLWWLRSTGIEQCYAPFVSGGGNVISSGISVNNMEVCVRPVICVQF